MVERSAGGAIVPVMIFAMAGPLGRDRPAAFLSDSAVTRPATPSCYEASFASRAVTAATFAESTTSAPVS